MKMRSYIKKREESETLYDFATDLELQNFRCFSKFKKVFRGLLILALVALPLFVFGKYNMAKPVDVAEDTNIQLVSAPLAAVSTAKSTISIPKGTVNANPFLPYRSLGDEASTNVPESALTEPPEFSGQNTDAVNVMKTTVSGILYDKYSPSAILNIEGSDYLVKKGDVISNYKVLAIAQDSVTVQLGSNTYKAGIGELLTEGTLNHNDVSNLSNKFGGAK